MVGNVFALHQITGDEALTFPFNVKEYQRYVFGDDRLAYRFGADCAKAFIAHLSGSGAAQHTTIPTSNQSAPDDYAVAVISNYVPTATHALRHHFTAYLNRHLLSTNANPAIKIDVYLDDERPSERTGPRSSTAIYRLDRERVGHRSIIILGDIRLAPDQESQIQESLRSANISNKIAFVYLASAPPSKANLLSPLLGFIVSPSLKDIEDFANAPGFVMNASFVRYVLGLDDEVFCRFLRRQDDGCARGLLDCAIGGRYYTDEMYAANVKFLQWEVGTRESL